MQGTILILDGVSTNRIMLKVQLSAAWYRVVQADSLNGLIPLVRRIRPDLILCATKLSDGDVTEVSARLRSDEELAGIPVIAVTPQIDANARLRLLAAGIDDVLSQPVDDVVLLARIRSLIRAHSSAQDICQQATMQSSGFAEPVSEFSGPLRADVAFVTQTPGAGAVWRARMKGHVRHRLHLHKVEAMQKLLSDSPPDAIVVELRNKETGLRLLADLRARNTTRNAAVIAVTNPADPHLAADALDLGADDALPSGFCVEELSLRLDTQLRRKARLDRYRESVRNGLKAAFTDPMTGLHNRRHALPELHRIAREASETGNSFAVMMVDLDHFKHINDRYGHATGDAVLIETARRLRGQLRPHDMIARVGGEEFLIVLPATSRREALGIADRMCQTINGEEFHIADQTAPIGVTTSIGVVVARIQNSSSCAPTRHVPRLIEQADKALYEAKDAGRNQVSFIAAA